MVGRGFSSYHAVTRIVTCVTRECFLICDKGSKTGSKT